MLARCSRCQNTFFTDHTGRQRCPRCQAEVILRDPNAAPPAPGASGAAPEPPPIPEPNPYAPPHAGGPPPPPPPAPGAFQPTPWERRRELGLWPALRDTLKLTLFEPKKIFDTMRYDLAEGALPFVLFAAVIPQVLGGLLQQLVSDPIDQLRQMAGMYEAMGQSESARGMEEAAAFLEQYSGAASIAGVAVVPLFTFVGLYVFAGLSHGILMLLGKAKGGFIATFKVFAYSMAAGVFALVPGCGGLIVWAWASLLQVYGLSKAHDTTVGVGVGAVVGMHLFLICCCCGLPAIAAVAAMTGAAGAAP